MIIRKRSPISWQSSATNIEVYKTFLLCLIWLTPPILAPQKRGSTKTNLTVIIENLFQPDYTPNSKV